MTPFEITITIITNTLIILTIFSCLTCLFSKADCETKTKYFYTVFVFFSIFAFISLKHSNETVIKKLDKLEQKIESKTKG